MRFTPGLLSFPLFCSGFPTLLRGQLGQHAHLYTGGKSGTLSDMHHGSNGVAGPSAQTEDRVQRRWRVRCVRAYWPRVASGQASRLVRHGFAPGWADSDRAEDDTADTPLAVPRRPQHKATVRTRQCGGRVAEQARRSLRARAGSDDADAGGPFDPSSSGRRTFTDVRVTAPKSREIRWRSRATSGT